MELFESSPRSNLSLELRRRRVYGDCRCVPRRPRRAAREVADGPEERCPLGDGQGEDAEEEAQQQQGHRHGMELEAAVFRRPAQLNLLPSSRWRASASVPLHPHHTANGTGWNTKEAAAASSS